MRQTWQLYRIHSTGLQNQHDYFAVYVFVSIPFILGLGYKRVDKEFFLLDFVIDSM